MGKMKELDIVLDEMKQEIDTIFKFMLKQEERHQAQADFSQFMRNR